VLKNRYENEHAAPKIVYKPSGERFKAFARSQDYPQQPYQQI